MPMLLGRDMSKVGVRPKNVCMSTAFNNKKRSGRVLDQLSDATRLCDFSRSRSTRGGVMDSDHFAFIHDGFHCLPGFLHCCNIRKISTVLTSLNISSRRFSSSRHKFSFHFRNGLSVQVGGHTNVATTSMIGACSRRHLTGVFCLCNRLGGDHGLTSTVIGTQNMGRVIAVNSFLRIVGPLFKQRHRGGRLTGIFRTLHVRMGRRVRTLGRVLCTTAGTLGPKNELMMVACRSLRSHVMGGVVGAKGVRNGTRRSFFNGMRAPFGLIGGGIVITNGRRIAHGPHSQDTGLEVTRGEWQSKEEARAGCAAAREQAVYFTRTCICPRRVKEECPYRQLFRGASPFTSSRRSPSYAVRERPL